MGNPRSELRRRAGRAVVGLAALAAFTRAEAAVLKTIAVDGNLSDWTDVLAEPFQHAYDGPAAGLVDLDAPVPSTGRDLTEFAWTYDDAYLYLCVSRVGSLSNRQLFWFYIDANENGLMESGEPVVSVSWFGSSRRTDIELYRYSAAAGGGDPLGSPAGYADGWTMPGTVQSAVSIESLSGGESSGVRMESRISWSALGVAAGTPVKFHVSASASTNLPSQIQDNMGGPGGLVGSTRLSGAVLAPDRSATVASGGRVAFAHTLTNAGLTTDGFELTAARTGSSVPSATAWYRDTNGNGLLDPGEPLAADANANGTPDVPSVAAGASVSLLWVVDVPPAAVDGAAATFALRATSIGSPGAFGAATDNLTVATPSMTLVKSVSSAAAVPGDVLTYTVAYAAGGSAPAYGVTLVDPIPSQTDYMAGSASAPGASVTFSHDGGASWNGSDALPVTHVRFVFAAPLAPGASGSASFRVTVR